MSEQQARQIIRWVRAGHNPRRRYQVEVLQNGFTKVRDRASGLMGLIR